MSESVSWELGMVYKRETIEGGGKEERVGTIEPTHGHQSARHYGT